MLSTIRPEIKTLLKIKALFDALRNNCLKIDLEHDQSLDEKMTFAKTKRRGIRQYLSKKIHNWGFKNFGKSGITCAFFIYTGASSIRGALVTVKMLFLAWRNVCLDTRIINFSLANDSPLFQ